MGIQCGICVAGYAVRFNPVIQPVSTRRYSATLPPPFKETATLVAASKGQTFPFENLLPSLGGMSITSAGPRI